MIFDAFRRFRLSRLIAQNPGLGEAFVWGTNPWPAVAAPRLHIGCGEKVLDGFVNVDFLPHDARVLKWNLLNDWPEKLALEAAFSEDVLEHFGRNEQLLILCEMNRALRPGGTFRVLMPDMAKLLRFAAEFDEARHASEWLCMVSGARTGTDALNYGARFSGHRWLHDDASLERLARDAGFEKRKTTCRESGVAELCGLNLRDETNSLSFANDLVKTRPIERLRAAPARVENAKLVEWVTPSIPLYRATNHEPIVRYELPREVRKDDVVLVCARGANTSQQLEHNYSQLYFLESEEGAHWFDTSLRSAPFLSLVSARELDAKPRIPGTWKSLRFDPSQHPDDYFTVGPLDIYLRA